MTLLSRVQAIGWFDVGEGGDASAQYPITRLVENHEHTGAEGANGEAIRVVRLTFDSFAVANSETTNALVDRIHEQLAHRGRRVRVNEMDGTARVFGAGGASGGALAGYPRVTVEIIPGNSVPPLQFFRCTVETREPIATGLPMHTYNRAERVDSEGLLTITQSGEYRVDNGVDPKTQLLANVLIPAETDAIGNGRRFSKVVRLSHDPTLAAYEYTDTPPGVNPPGDAGVDDAEVRDVLTSNREGRRTRIVSGFATGAGATAFAQSQAPGGASFILRQTISQPAVPTGRVDFSYEVLDGATHNSFPSITLFNLEQEIALVGGGRAVQSSPYADASPLLSFGPEGPYVYRETTRIEFSGDWADAVPPFSMDEANVSATPATAKRVRSGGVKELAVTRLYVYDSEQSLPDPLEAPTL